MKMILIMLYFSEVLLPCWSLWRDQGRIASRKFLTKKLGFRCPMECNVCGHLRREGESPHNVKSTKELTMRYPNLCQWTESLFCVSLCSIYHWTPVSVSDMVRFQSKLDVHCKPYSTTLAVW
jgi:hypothetical protein